MLCFVKRRLIEDPVHTTPGESEKGGFTLLHSETQMSPVHTSEKEFENTKIMQRLFWICVWRKLGDAIIFEKFFFKMFSFLSKTKNRSFPIPQVWTAFWLDKALFTWRIRPKRRNKARFSNSFGVVCTTVKAMEEYVWFPPLIFT